MNGIDLLFIVGGFIFLFIVVEIATRYHTWSEWDRNRRHQRRLDRFELIDHISEQTYRNNLRLMFKLGLFTTHIHTLNATFSEATKAINNFNLKLKEVGEAMKWSQNA